MMGRASGGRWRGRRRCAAMTLVELLVALIIVVIIAAGISRLLVSSWSSQRTVANQNAVQQEASAATDAIVDRLRGASGVQSGTAAELTAVFPGGSTERYYVVGRELRRDRFNAATGVTTVGEVISRIVESLRLEYVRREGNALVSATPGTAESVTVSVGVALEGYRARETSVVKLRNKY